MTINTICGEITAEQSTLNYISILAREAAEEYSKDGYNTLAKGANDFARNIYREIEKSGRYKDF